ncbi:MAG: GAF domain-containing sensor histidine kinase [Gemmatimonadales bacterium]|nr:GAF domain-containing sensor histidine kinase [Gemmatimonadales bacterium]
MRPLPAVSPENAPNGGDGVRGNPDRGSILTAPEGWSKGEPRSRSTGGWRIEALPASSRRWWAYLYSTRGIVLWAGVLGWFAIYLAMRGRWEGYIFAVVTTGLAVLALYRNQLLTQRYETRVRTALASAAARNRELETLRRLAASLLAGRELTKLFEEIAQAATELLQAEVGLVSMVVEEGRFLKVVAAAGAPDILVGQLVPADQSLVGWVATNEEPLVSEDIEQDPRNFHLANQGVDLKTCAIIPLRSAGVVIGTVSVYNRPGGRPFDESDLNLLETLGDQVVVGLDRANMLAVSRQNEEALAQKNEELLRITELKDQFLANMSHELRTPLNAIIGFSELLLTEDLGEVNSQQRDFLDSVWRNGQHLLELINDVLDLSKIEAGRMKLALARTDLGEAIHGAVTDTASLRSAKEQVCKVEMDDGPFDIMADGQRVRQVLYNLLSNASKYTTEGGQITVAVVKTQAPLPYHTNGASGDTRLVNRDAVWISVMDTGIGIRPDDLSLLFTEFTQVDSSASREQQGTGLGLALCRRFVELHGGTIGVESIRGMGSAFWFILPLEGPRIAA